eukprot:TRINITY_DN2170_c0_g1_i1.p1 TRINITY_DN2170_c0_g1~~TRINITY_DN2170_c0_g1_i1.p1  ORF type:complete len:125 (-),score=29.24 TRINITY_DN2170_c0_g1_i1:275-649(-)
MQHKNQSSTQEKPFLDEIAKGSRPKLHHVEPVEKDLSSFGVDTSAVKVKKVDRKPLLAEIQGGVSLGSVKTDDKSNPKIDETVKIQKVGKRRENLLQEVESFGKNNLHHVETHDASVPKLTGKQ